MYLTLTDAYNCIKYIPSFRSNYLHHFLNSKEETASFCNSEDLKNKNLELPIILYLT